MGPRPVTKARRLHVSDQSEASLPEGGSAAKADPLGFPLPAADPLPSGAAGGLTTHHHGSELGLAIDRRLCLIQGTDHLLGSITARHSAQRPSRL